MAKYKAKFIDTSLAKAGEVFSVTPDNKIVFIDMNSTGQKETFILTPADISNKYVDLIRSIFVFSRQNDTNYKSWSATVQY